MEHHNNVPERSMFHAGPIVKIVRKSLHALPCNGANRQTET